MFNEEKTRLIKVIARLENQESSKIKEILNVYSTSRVEMNIINPFDNSRVEFKSMIKEIDVEKFQKTLEVLRSLGFKVEIEACK